MAFAAKLRISLIARGALFLNETPCTYFRNPELSAPTISLPSLIPSFSFPLPRNSPILHGRSEKGKGGEVERVIWRLDFIKLILDFFSCQCQGVLFFKKGNVHVYVGGWCIRAQRRRRWRIVGWAFWQWVWIWEAFCRTSIEF
jgi:hypothetical protein